jgi:hypothetical protein
MRNPARTEREAAIIGFEVLTEIWIRSNPQNDPERCAWCDQPGALIAIKLLDGQAGATWLHAACWRDWHRERKALAIAALDAFGITRDGLLPPCAADPAARDPPAIDEAREPSEPATREMNIETEEPQ